MYSSCLSNYYKNQQVDTIALLCELGFTEYEARAYLSLVRAGSLNGYEVAKASGLPRANVYGVLDRLLVRGAARRLETRGGVRYRATAPERLVQRLGKAHQQTLAAVRDALAELAPEKESDPVFNVRGYGELLAQAHTLIDKAQASLLVAIQPREAAALAKPLQEARARGVAITTLCMEACPAECGGCQGDIHRYHLAPTGGARWLMLVADDNHMIAGEILAEDALAAETEQQLIVVLAASYIRQSLALVTVAGELGDRFHGLLSVKTRGTLDALYPEGGFAAFLRRVIATNTL